MTEILLAIAIVGVIAALVLPAIVTNYQNRALDIGFEREIKTISGAVRNLAVSENKKDFFSTMMYTDTGSSSYDTTSGKFVKKYLKVSKYCGDSNGDCFGGKYYNYNEITHKKEIYEPVYKGACASLKNGASICVTPQVGSEKISVLLDINGKKGPNIFGRDLRHFTIDPQVEKTSLSGTTTEVLSTPEPDLKLKGACAENALSKECCDTQTVKKGDACCIHYKSQVGHSCYEAPESPKSACEIDNNSIDCCKTRTITSNTDACCYYEEIRTGNASCHQIVDIALNCIGSPVVICTTSINPYVAGFQTSNGAKKYNMGEKFNFYSYGSSWRYRLWYNGNQFFEQRIDITQLNNFHVKYNVTTKQLL